MPTKPRMRPRFELELEVEGQQVLRRLRELLERGDTGLDGQVLDRHAFLQMPAAQRSLLSPYLNIQVDEQDGRHLLHGRFSPQPNVWTGFMAVYGVLIMLGLAGLMYGFAQMMVDEPPWPMLSAPIAIGLIAFVYGAAVIGQGLTADQMYEQRALVERAVRECRPATGG